MRIAMLPFRFFILRRKLCNSRRKMYKLRRKTYNLRRKIKNSYGGDNFLFVQNGKILIIRSNFYVQNGYILIIIPIFVLEIDTM